MSNKNMLEEGLKVQIDFLKLRKVYDNVVKKGGEDVIPVIVQDVDTKKVLILAYVNKEALDYSLKNKVATFWSTSRNELWIKGLSSGSTLKLIEVLVNCEQNSLLYLVRPIRNCGACHTKKKNGKYRSSCYYRTIENMDGILQLTHNIGEIK